MTKIHKLGVKKIFGVKKIRGVKIFTSRNFTILNPKAIKMRRPLVQNRSDEEWTKSILRNEDLFRMGSKCALAQCCLYVSQSVCLSVQGLSLIAPERLGRSGRNKHHKMRQSAGTTMAFVTWRHVPRGTCHVPPREPLAKPYRKDQIFERKVAET